MKPVSFFDASFFDETNAADVVPLSVVVDDGSLLGFYSMLHP